MTEWQRKEYVDSVVKYNTTIRKMLQDWFDNWWRENKDYLYWNKYNNNFVIDKRAKVAQTPINQVTKALLDVEELKQQQQWEAIVEKTCADLDQFFQQSRTK